MAYTLEELAGVLKASFSGNGALEISHVCGLSNITEGGLCYLTTDQNIAGVETSAQQAAEIKKGFENMGSKVAVIVKPGFESEGHNLIYAEDPLSCHVAATHLLHPPPKPAGKIHPTAVIGKNVTIGEGVTIDPYCVIYDDVTIEDHCVLYAKVTIMHGSKIGEASTLYPHVLVREGCQIGKRAVIHGGAVIGSDGHGYFQRDGVN